MGADSKENEKAHDFVWGLRKTEPYPEAIATGWVQACLLFQEIHK